MRQTLFPSPSAILFVSLFVIRIGVAFVGNGQAKEVWADCFSQKVTVEEQQKNGSNCDLYGNRRKSVSSTHTHKRMHEPQNNAKWSDTQNTYKKVDKIFASFFCCFCCGCYFALYSALHVFQNKPVSQWLAKKNSIECLSHHQQQKRVA